MSNEEKKPSPTYAFVSGSPNTLKLGDGDRRYLPVDPADEERGIRPSSLPTGAHPLTSDEIHALITPAVRLQPRPKGLGVAVFPLVRADLNARERAGVETYGESLRTENGRSMLVDAYQEAIDLVVYLRGEIEERAKLVERIASAELEIEGARGELQTYRKIAAEAVAQANTYRSAIVEIAQESEREASTRDESPGACEVRGWLSEEIRKILGREAESFTLAAKLKEWRAELDRVGAGQFTTADAKEARRSSSRISSILGEDVLP